MSFETQTAPSDLLGQRLIAKELASAQEIARAIDLQVRIGGRLGAILMRSGVISETKRPQSSGANGRKCQEAYFIFLQL
ncbi:hypothetical protein JVX91_13585 [Pseudomonas sp. PDNC002]|uniref:hypothetical protein n=1 Tax=Pseudomonas sp. PDNC002 TaxID=2811422 RepID=UPI0019664688|nr:hypothetical protein [Pseudomonas sp. PDNC002]QRY82082.1 hypothetical protein JVX91_13585 [Pseudomonas sp. PDNC002]